MLAEQITALCAGLGLAQPSPDASGVYDLTLPDGLTMRIGEDRNGVFFTGTVQTLPEAPDERDTLCRELLSLSLGRAAKECASSVPRLTIAGDTLYLRERRASPTGTNSFETAVEDFANLLEKWRSLATKEQGRQLLRGGGMRNIILP